MKKKIVIARVLEALLKSDIKLESPYDVENWCQDNLTHENLRPFFYKGEREIDVSVAVLKTLVDK